MTIDRDFYSDAANAWFKGVFIVSDYDDNGNIAHIIYGCQNIDDSKKHEEALIKKSNTDELTGAYNRRAYEDKIKELEQGQIPEDLVYISVDVNGLKVVSDSLGHSAGDELIIGAYNCLNKNLSLLGNVYRTGGDEFVVLVNATDEQLRNALDQLELSTERWTGNFVDELSLSYGYVLRKDNPHMTLHEISIIADKEMYKAKSAYYSKKGVDRRGQAAANTALCSLYTKILKINITDDTYSIVKMDSSEKTTEMGFADTISGWLSGFGKSGQVHNDDLDVYLKKTDLENLRTYFNSGKTSISIQYRRKYPDGFKQVAMDMIPADDYSAENQTLFLYGKNIEM